jgi:Ca-activated chloride channel family protein
MSEIQALHFIRPLWLLLLPLVPLLPWLWKRARRPSGDWSRVCDPHLLRWLSVQRETKGSSRAGPWLAALALLLAILALAGPAWQKLPDPSWSARDARVIALDLSDSMLAEDLRPNRLIRTRFRLADLLESTEEGQVGLVSYAGDAYVVSPLTNDTNTIANLLPALQPDIIPVAGSRADRALEMAAELLRRSGLSRGEILLVTDSATARDAARARDLRDQGIFTSVLAVGTPDGAPIPSGGGFVNDRAGNVVIARLDRSALRAVAEAGGGRYTELAAASPASVLWLDQDGSEFARRDDALGERWKDAGPWLVLLLLPFALAGFRRGLLFVAPLVFLNGLILPQDAAAAWWEDLWLRKDQQAYQALADKEPDRAAALANDPALAGEGWYRSGDYANARESWSRVASADAHYNRGNDWANTRPRSPPTTRRSNCSPGCPMPSTTARWSSGSCNNRSNSNSSRASRANRRTATASPRNRKARTRRNPKARRASRAPNRSSKKTPSRRASRVNRKGPSGKASREPTRSRPGRKRTPRRWNSGCGEYPTIRAGY